MGAVGRERITYTDRPVVGADIYVDTHLFLGHGEDDVRGGLARVVAVHEDAEYPDDPMVDVAEHPDYSYNWALLSREQDRLRAEFGDRRAYADPDLRPEFDLD
ncbi:hypothetical protein [Nocardia sp. NPDC050710]|uniref:hypothetical protein n=1 Tax=Nocardia sp. NPDC050710 TaxID=3157220 RepID=UPI0033E58EB0